MEWFCYADLIPVGTACGCGSRGANESASVAISPWVLFRSDMLVADYSSDHHALVEDSCLKERYTKYLEWGMNIPEPRERSWGMLMSQDPSGPVYRFGGMQA